ncbi:MAG: outer-membrane lipoprotein carrier protein LolA [Treponema sp.]|nr:outer-membrane lipoprotein carrier protein LolA [Treponema sp.]
MLKQGIFLKKQWVFLGFLLILNISQYTGSPLECQEIVTADGFLRMVSERYGSIRDYEANIVMRSGNSGDMIGVVNHLSPSFLRIDFTRPADQAIIFNGELLTIYLPDYRMVLNQSINQTRRSSASGAALASAQGLTMLRNNYVSSYDVGPSPVPLDNNSREMVIRLRLTRRSISEGFREIMLSINPDTLLIRRIEGRTIADGDVRFDFTNIRTNQGIPEQRFIFDHPPASNIYHNFLFRDSD